MLVEKLLFSKVGRALRPKPYVKAYDVFVELKNGIVYRTDERVQLLAAGA
jgi:hypothetical protein